MYSGLINYCYQYVDINVFVCFLQTERRIYFLIQFQDS